MHHPRLRIAAGLGFILGVLLTPRPAHATFDYIVPFDTPQIRNN